MRRFEELEHPHEFCQERAIIIGLKKQDRMFNESADVRKAN
jgi:hypothetical protein